MATRGDAPIDISNVISVYIVMVDVKLLQDYLKSDYRQTSNISRTLVGNKIVDNSDVVGESPVGAALTTSSFST